MMIRFDCQVYLVWSRKQLVCKFKMKFVRTVLVFWVLLDKHQSQGKRSFRLPLYSPNLNTTLNLNLDETLNFAKDMAKLHKWSEIFLISDHITDVATVRYIVKHLEFLRFHFINVPFESDIGTSLQDDVSSHNHNVLVWCTEEGLNVTITQAISESLFKTKVAWIFLVPHILLSSLSRYRHDFGDSVFFGLPVQRIVPFDNEVALKILSLKTYGRHLNFISAGYWSRRLGMNWTESSASFSRQLTQLDGRTLKVLVREETPYYYYKGDDSEIGLKTPTGLVHELLDILSTYLNASFDRIVKTNTPTGALNDSTNQWSGLMGSLQRKEVDIVAADLSLTENRLEVADFSPPFMVAFFGIVVRRPPPYTDYGNYASPFHTNVWILVGVAVALTTVLLTTTSLWSTCSTSPTAVRGRREGADLVDAPVVWRFDFFNSLFLMVGLLTQQGSDYLPNPPSAKVVFTVYCFFAMLILQSYSSALTASFSVSHEVQPFSEIDDLVDNLAYTIGIRTDGSNVEYLKTSRSEVMKKAWARVNTNPNNFCPSTTEGIQKAYDEKFAFIASFSTLQYHIGSNCSFILIPQGRIFKGYHFAFPKNSPYVKTFSKAFHEMFDAGILSKLENKYFPPIVSCVESRREGIQIGIQNMYGAFLFLLGTLAISLVLMTFERIVYMHKTFWYKFKLGATGQPYLNKTGKFGTNKYF